MSLARRIPWYAVPLGLFALTRIIDFVLLMVFVRHQLPTSQLPHNNPVRIAVDPPTYLNGIQSWDGQWYRRIAEMGYPTSLPRTSAGVQQNAWAFFPGYPAVVWVLTRLGISFGLAASFVSLVAGGSAMCLLYRLLEARSGRWLAGCSVLALCCAPAAPTFQFAYSESLALLLLVTCWWCLEQRRYVWLLVFVGLLSLTRAVTAPLALVLFLAVVMRWRSRHEDLLARAELFALLGGVFVAGLGVLAWPVVAAVTTGDVSAYADTQQAWFPQSRSETWLVSLVHSAPPGRWVFVVVLVGLVCVIALRNRSWGTDLRLWTVVYPVYVLAATPATSSIFRYLLLTGPAWWPTPQQKPGTMSSQARAAVMGGILVVGTLSQVAWLHWFFVVTSANIGPP